MKRSAASWVVRLFSAAAMTCASASLAAGTPAQPTAPASRFRTPGEKERLLETPVFVGKQGARESLRASLASRRRVRMGPWYYVGPFANERDVGQWSSYLPERDLDLGATYAGLAGRPCAWQRWEKFRDGRNVNRLVIAEGRDRVVGYAFRRLHAEREAEVPVVFDSRGPLVVWLNGEQVLTVTDRDRRSFEATAGRLWLKLRAGENTLLVKCCGGSNRIELAFGDYQSLRSAVEEMMMARAQKQVPPDDRKLLHEFLIERDWLQWDRVALAEGGYAAGAKKALQLATDTLAFVTRAAPRPKLARELAALADAVAAAKPEADGSELYFRARRLRRRIVLSHPLLGFDRLLINQRTPPRYSHMCDQYLGRHSGAGAGLAVLEDWRGVPQPRPLVTQDLPEGTVHHPDLSYDGARVVFAFCDHTPRRTSERRFFLFEAAADGSFLRQLTGVPGRDPLAGQDGRETVVIEDWDPCYLPVGGIVFISTRNQGFGRCHGGRYTPSYVLYRCDADGGNIRRLSWGEANEWDPSVLHDGQIVYTRWDYINRHDTIYQSLWTTRPDGTATAHFYGNYTRNPCMIAEAKAIPGSDRTSALAMAHHSYSAGSILVVDLMKGLDGKDPVRRITPEVSFPETEGWPTGAYCTHWPLSEELYLAAYTHDRLVRQGGRQRDNAYGIYVVDALGGRELIYRDPNISCFSPIPIQPRSRPPALPSTVQHSATEGVFFLHNVYASGHHNGQPIPDGKAKYLRVAGILEQPDRGAPIRSRANNEIVKWIVGTVPFDENGSAAFRAPANEPLLLQVLDANYMSIMSMRSQVYLQPGEHMSCIGCHEPTGTAATLHQPRALQIRRIDPPPGPRYDGGFSFARTVQPVLDRYCIRCHGLAGKTVSAAEREEARQARTDPPKGRACLLGTHTRSFSEAYEALTGRELIRLAQRNGETTYSRLMDYGSHASKLAPMLLAGHKGRVKLDAESLRRIVGWLDLNVQYYGDYERRRPERQRIGEAAEKALREHLAAACGRCHKDLASQPLAALVNVAWPEASRVLKAPLPTADGGWGQCKAAFTGTRDKQYQALREKVQAAVAPPKPR